MQTKSLTNRSFAVLLTTILLLVAIPVTSVLALSSGPRYPGTTSGASPWTNTNFISVPADTNYATYVIPNGGTTSAITGTNYGFTIPAGSTINGITVEIGRASSSAGGGFSINDATVRLLGGTVAGTNLATATDWPTSQGTASYGGATNTWGNTWTAAQINSSNFGVTLTAQNQSGFSTRTASVDFIRITVEYSSTATTTAVTSSVNPSTFGNPVTFTATVTSTSTPTGSVNFVIDGGSPVAGSVGTTTATTATWTYTTSALTGGSHTVQANYVHSNGFLDSNGSLSGGQTVNKAAQATLTAVATPGTVVYGSTAALSSTGGSGTGTVTFSAGASTGCSVAGSTLSVTNASGSCSITATKAADGNYLVATSAPLTVTLTKAVPTVTTWPTASGITYGDALSASTLSGGSASVAGSFAFTDPTIQPPAGSYSASVTFTPTDTANYQPVSGNVDVQVAQATPTVTWPTASGITYGDALSASTLSGGSASVAGSFAFTDPTIQPPAGSYSASVTFVPSDANYQSVTGSVSVQVAQATPTVTWPTASGITYGDALSASALSGGSASVAGSFAFTDPTIQPPAGSYSAAVTFVPSDANYQSVTGSVSVQVAQATPTITWPTASGITYGDALSASTLSGGSASVTGSFAFTDPTIQPPAGSYSAAVTFTPTDTANYQPVSGNVDVQVAQVGSIVTTWPTASGITYGDALSASTLSGGSASVAGSFAFTDPTIQPPAGSYSASVTFTPSDIANYQPATGSVSVQVAQATPTVTTWPTASGITYGDALSASALSGGSASVAGSFAFTDPTIQPPAGSYSASVTFIPSDANYQSVTGSVNVQVAKADAVCTVTGYSVTHDGNPHTATGSCQGVAIDGTLTGLDLSATTHTAVGNYNDAWTFTAPNGNYNNANGTVNDVINAVTDTTAPVVSSVVRADADNTSASRVNFTVSFSEAVTGVDVSAPYADFNLVTTGVGKAFITAVSGSGATYTVTVNTGVGSGTIRLDVVDDDSIIDAASNPLGGAFSTGQVYTIVKTPTFTDVPATNPYYQDIEVLYANGLTAGCGTSPLRFCPDQTMNRGEAAVFMLRGNLGSSFAPDAATHIFKDDWKKGTWAEPWSEAMYKKGMSAGCSSSPLKYCPWDQIPREQAVIFALRLKYGMNYIPPAATGTLFADMTNPSYFATSWAEQAYKDGLIASCGTSGGKPLFCPKNLVSRGLAAQMIVKAKNLTMP